MSSWYHCADYERGTFGREMYELEQAAIALGPAGAGVLAGVDQLTAKYRHMQAETLGLEGLADGA